jgi:Beta-glucan synthesis-associated protein SKN1/KRE6/Sbg1
MACSDLVHVANWQTINLTTMMFPAEMLVDYVRVYQRKESMNVGCNPKAYPTMDYIDNHLHAYQGMLLPCVLWCYCCEAEVLLDANSTWTWKKPLNRLVRFASFTCLPPLLIRFYAV